MARNICPSCGNPYNGKKCRNCLYEAFPETTVRKPAVKTGTPPVADPPARQKQARQKTPRRNPLSRFVLLLTLIYAVMPMLRNWGLDLKEKERESSVRLIAVQPEPVLSAEDMVILHESTDITIFTSQEDLVDFSDGFCLYVQNDSSLNVTVSAGDIAIDGVPMPHSRLVCRAGANAIGKGWLELDAQDLKNAGTPKYRTLSLDLAVLQNSRLLFETGEILITSGVDAYE
ncbi:MAG: hypothetical protein IJB59_13615 [Oscillospiraceae bacterium]|nr:hypothetical protein [Oscillospiraceae bacterium]